MSTDAALLQALRDGVLYGVQQTVTNLFNVYRQQRKEGQTQRHRTEEGLIETILAAEDLLTMIEELKEQSGTVHGTKR